MNVNGVILVADITGYTQFLSATEIEHANFIENKILAPYEGSYCNGRCEEVGVSEVPPIVSIC